MSTVTVDSSCHRCGKATEDLIEVNASTFMEADPLRADRYLEETHYKVICTSCRDILENLLIKAEKEDHLPARLSEGMHFYKEGPLVVFTEYYHILKSYCCQNRCRHCAYGLKSEM